MQQFLSESKCLNLYIRANRDPSYVHSPSFSYSVSINDVHTTLGIGPSFPTCRVQLIHLCNCNHSSFLLGLVAGYVPYTKQDVSCYPLCAAFSLIFSTICRLLSSNLLLILLPKPITAARLAPFLFMYSSGEAEDDANDRSPAGTIASS